MSVMFQQELPVYRSVDVVVVGAGPAGIGAAVAAARNGAKTLVFEAHGCIGGMGTSGMVSPFMTSYDAPCEKMIIRGVFEELVNRMVEIGGAVDPKNVRNEQPYASYFHIGHNNVTPFAPHAFKLIGMRMLRESGAELLLQTQFVNVIKDGDRITGVVINNKDGLSVIEAKIVIDCSGDADVAARAGVNYIMGNEEDGNLQPASMFMRIADADMDVVNAHMAEHSDEIRPFFGPFSWIIKEFPEDWDNFPRGEICIFADVTPGEFSINCSRILDIDATKAEHVTRATMIGQEQCQHIFQFMKKHAPGFENSRIIATADAIGIRETRHIEGEYKLTGDEVAACKVHEDAIACMATNMDTHNKDNPGGSFFIPKNGPYFTVPYLCLVPKGISNLLVAGRAISADAIAGSAIRMMPSCMAFGQAAGTAAAMCAAQNIAPKDVNVQNLRQTLVAQGQFVGD
ncbi:MAG: FAD-dependent oxidoreductase [Oscillospiraceae bacterium]|nr:FAD-dependent oxidoreductase [Oscillospiraceae bacterium]